MKWLRLVKTIKHTFFQCEIAVVTESEEFLLLKSPGFRNKINLSEVYIKFKMSRN